MSASCINLQSSDYGPISLALQFRRSIRAVLEKIILKVEVDTVITCKNGSTTKGLTLSLLCALSLTACVTNQAVPSGTTTTVVNSGAVGKAAKTQPQNTNKSLAESKGAVPTPSNRSVAPVSLADLPRGQLPVRAECTEIKWKGPIKSYPGGPTGTLLTYAGGDCDNYGKPTGLAAVKNERGRGMEGELEGMFVAGELVPDALYTWRRSINGVVDTVCKNIPFSKNERNELTLEGNLDTECVLNRRHSPEGVKKKQTQIMRMTLTGPMHIGFGYDYEPTFGRKGNDSGLKGSIHIRPVLEGSVLGAWARLDPELKNVNDHSMNATNERYPTPEDLLFQVTGKSDKNTWSGNLEFMFGGERFKLANIKMEIGYHPVSLCDNKTLTILNEQGQQLVLTLNGRSKDCFVTGFSLPDGTRLEASDSKNQRHVDYRGEVNSSQSAAYLSTKSGPAEFRFGKLQFVPLWGKMTWPDGRVYDGNFKDGKPAIQ